MRVSTNRCIVSTIAMAGLGACVGLAADRTVLGEEFTATWCVPCQTAGNSLIALENQQPERLVVVQIHNGGDAFVVNPYSDSRMSFYNVTGFPTVWFDGTSSLVGVYDLATTTSVYRSMINARLAIPTPVIVEQWATQSNATTWVVNTRYRVEASAPAALTFKTRTLQVRDHYPVISGATHYAKCLRSFSPTNTITLAPGASYQTTWTCVLPGDDSSVMANIGFVSFAQEIGTPTTSTADVLQADLMSYPYPSTPPVIPPAGTPGDTDLDGHVSLTDLANLLTNFGATGGRSWAQGDFTGEGAVNLTDLAMLLQNFGS